MNVLAFCLAAFAGLVCLVHFAGNVYADGVTTNDTAGLAFSAALLLTAALILPS